MLRTSCRTLTSTFRTATRAGSTGYLPDLKFDYGELEPYISAEIMKIHHTKHHQAYVTNLNASLEKYADAEAKGDLATMIQLQQAIRFNGGGHVNHSIFWTNLAPKSAGGGVLKAGDLATAINTKWGSLEKFQAQLAAQSAGVQGSGWGWLVYNKATAGLDITTRPNQDPVSTDPNMVPLLGIDVWEHAYYLQYKNVRPDYLKAIWNVINWDNVTERYDAARK
eukprot:c13038_g1_i1.p1 GENE.c13038_g1_i1~~c13038_g1_i1.p1  ORF type:complete len:223 (+),score=40.87 c13038_g1_i1:27-695(+)